MFRFDRRAIRQRRAANLLLVMVPMAAAAYLPLDVLLSRWWGGFWGVLGAILASGAPLATLGRVAASNRSPRQAVVEGFVITACGAVLYAWVFGGAW